MLVTNDVLTGRVEPKHHRGQWDLGGSAEVNLKAFKASIPAHPQGSFWHLANARALTSWGAANTGRQEHEAGGITPVQPLLQGIKERRTVMSLLSQQQ